MHTVAAQLESDQEILEAYHAGEQDQAITAMVRKYQRFAYTVALRYLSSTEDARDCAQEVMIKAFKGLGRFRSESSLQTWIGKIARNTAISMYHRSRFLKFFAVGEGEDERDVPAKQLSPADHTEQNEFEVFFHTVLATLPPKQRATFMMRHYEDLTYEEISAQVGTSVGALKANYHWAVKKIAEKLKDTDYHRYWNFDEQQS